MALTYNISADGTYYTVNGGGDSGKTTLTGIVEIPSTYNGLSVKEIEADAFRGFSKITEVVCADSIDTIGNYAFSSSGIKNIKLPNNVNFKKIPDYCFSSCRSLTNLEIPNTVTVIATRSLQNCAYKNIIIPDSVETFGGVDMFYSCTKLETVHFGKSVKTVGANIFGNCPLMETITIDPDNETFYIENNCLIKKATKAIVCGIPTSIIPNDIKSIVNYAFYNMTGGKFKKVVIPKSCQVIGNASTFGFCNNLETFIIKNPKIIYTNANGSSNITAQNCHIFGSAANSSICTKPEFVYVLNNSDYTTDMKVGTKEVKCLQTGMYAL